MTTPYGRRAIKFIKFIDRTLNNKNRKTLKFPKFPEINQIYLITSRYWLAYTLCLDQDYAKLAYDVAEKTDNLLALILAADVSDSLSYQHPPKTLFLFSYI